jgi:glycosyltransferase involved in cell wall biosynthesis
MGKSEEFHGFLHGCIGFARYETDEMMIEEQEGAILTRTDDLVVGFVALLDETSGGVYQYTQSAVDGLRHERGYKLVVICRDDDNRFDRIGVEIRKISEPSLGFFTKLISYTFLLMFKKNWPLSRRFKNSFKDIDILVSPGISSFPLLGLPQPFLFTLHDLQERYYPEFFGLKERILRRILNKAYSCRAKRIICESNYVKKDIQNFLGVPENQICVIPSPPPEMYMNFQMSPEQKEQVRSKYNLPNRFLYFPAQSWPHKNHLRLLNALAIVREKHQDISLVLTGGKTDFFNQINTNVFDSHLEGAVHHVGYVDSNDLPYIYLLSEMLIMPTLFESISLPIFEAFSLGVAVCSSDAVALPEQVGDAGITFDPLDVKDMAEKICIFLDDSTLRKKKAVMGHEKIKNFSHEEYQGSLIEVIREAYRCSKE